MIRSVLTTIAGGCLGYTAAVLVINGTYSYNPMKLLILGMLIGVASVTTLIVSAMVNR